MHSTFCRGSNPARQGRDTSRPAPNTEGTTGPTATVAAVPPAEPTADTASAPARRTRPARTRIEAERRRSLLLAVPVLVAFAWLVWQHRWLHEDGLINLRVVTNLLNGHGPVYNVGERVEAFTSPAQVFVLTLGSILTLGRLPIEQVVFVTGLLCATGGLAAGIRGATHLWATDDDEATVPLGALVFAAIPFTWDFSTSGHEGAVSFLWLGVAFLLLARRRRDLAAAAGATDRAGAPSVTGPGWALIWLGAGPVLRPEFALFSAAFAAAWLWLHRGHLTGWWRTVLWLASLSGVYQVFRMGYYGLLVPNTALAKLGGPHGVSDGLTYVANFARPIALWLPLLLLSAGLVLALRNRPDGDRLVVVAAIVLPAVLQVAYLVEIGGDYINGRLLVAPLFALLAPTFVLPERAFRRSDRPLPVPVTIGAVAVVGWACICATSMRAPWQADSSNFLSSKWDARSFAIHRWVRDDARSIDAYSQTFLAGPANTLIRNDAQAGGDLLVLDDPFDPQVIQLAPGSGAIVSSTTVGALGVAVGPDVRIIDRLSLADPIGSHLPVTGTTAGHLRKLSVPWVWARAGHAADPASKAAAKAMTCGDLGQLLDAATEPMSVGRFFSNLVHSPTNTRVSVPSDPEAAVATFC